MVPYDQPEAALDLITRWIMDVPLAYGGAEFQAAPGIVLPN